MVTASKKSATSTLNLFPDGLSFLTFTSTSPCLNLIFLIILSSLFTAGGLTSVCSQLVDLIAAPESKPQEYLLVSVAPDTSVTLSPAVTGIFQASSSTLSVIVGSR